jgi:hypothetical protein
MTRIVTYAHRYKRPPKKLKAVALEVPAVVRVSTGGQPGKGRAGNASGGHRKLPPQDRNDLPAIAPGKGRGVGPVVPVDGSDVRSDGATTQPARIVRTRSRRASVFGDAPDMTPEEHKRRGEAADTLWRELVRRATEGK